MSNIVAAIPPWLIPLLLIITSILMLTVVLERGYVLFRQNSNLKTAEQRELLRLIREKRYDEAASFCRLHQHPAYRLVLSVLENRNGELSLEDIAEEAALNERKNLERYVSILGTFSTLAPMLGLLGTVTGMIKAFSAFANTASKASQLSIGVEEALVTTCLGLIVAIPSLVFYNNYVSRVNTLLAESDLVLDIIITDINKVK
jgi:biopolymer transport protein ExbB